MTRQYYKQTDEQD